MKNKKSGQKVNRIEKALLNDEQFYENNKELWEYIYPVLVEFYSEIYQKGARYRNDVRPGTKVDIYSVAAKYIDPIFENLILKPLKELYVGNNKDGVFLFRYCRYFEGDLNETIEEVESLSELYFTCGIGSSDNPKYSELIRQGGFEARDRFYLEYETITLSLGLKRNRLFIGSINIFDFFKSVATTLITHAGNRKSREKMNRKHKDYQLLCLDLRNTLPEARKTFGFHSAEGARDDREHIIYRYCKYCSEHTQAYESLYINCNLNKANNESGDFFHRLDRFNNYLNLALNKMNQAKQYGKSEREYCSVHTLDKARRSTNADYKKNNQQSFLSYSEDLVNKTMYAHIQNLYLLERFELLEDYQNPIKHFELIKMSRKMAEEYLLESKHQKFFEKGIGAGNKAFEDKVVQWLSKEVEVEVINA